MCINESNNHPKGYHPLAQAMADHIGHRMAEKCEKHAEAAIKWFEGEPREINKLNEMAAQVVAMCKKRGWSMHWTHRGAYLHLESSELIEAIRGKHGEPDDEAGDVLLVLMSITEYAGIPFTKVIENAKAKLAYLEDAPPYPGEQRADECQN